ncbi:hypothetical protein EYF80_013040 [Liparis tanakae]|uniref:Uncharacterized protein n=1 Tax=Liparis tanakae TaxID=230148 RepID=A0A4Z2IG91_9TELE|nr:hypothetical protein EYF80_013040 [Liparis tanakae]
MYVAMCSEKIDYAEDKKHIWYCSWACEPAIPSAPTHWEKAGNHILQSLQPLENRLPVDQVGNFAIPGSQPLVRHTPYLDELLGSVLDPAVHREQDNTHKH